MCILQTGLAINSDVSSVIRVVVNIVQHCIVLTR